MIRDVVESDSATLSDIYNYYIANSVITFEEQLISANNMKNRITDISNDNLPWLVAENNEKKVVGYAYASRWRARSAYRYSVEITVYLDHTTKNKGLGTQLYQALFNELEQKSIHTVIGGITLPNDASVALHEKFGMEKVAHFKEVGYKFNQLLDVGYWQVNL